MTSPLSIQQFAARIRSKYPGTYDDLSDSDLTAKTIAKYPQYADMLAPSNDNDGPIDLQPVASHALTMPDSVPLQPVASHAPATLTVPADTGDDAAPQVGTISQDTPGFVRLLKGTLANSAIGHALQTTMPKVAEATGLTPTDTVYNPDYQAHQAQLVVPENLIPASDHSAVGSFTRGALKGVGSLTSGKSMATMAAAAAAGGLAAPLAPALPQLMSAAFGAQTATDLLQQAPQLVQKWQAGDREGVFEQLGRMGVDAAMLKTMMDHAAGEADVSPADMTTDRGQMKFADQQAQKMNLPFVADQNIPASVPPFLRSAMQSAKPATDPAPVDTAEPAAADAEAALRPGPGAKTAGPRETPGSNLADLTGSLAAVESPKPSPVQRVQGAVARTPEAISDAVQKVNEAAQNAQDSMQALTSSYMNPPAWTDLKSAIGKWQGAEQYSAWELQNYTRAIKEAVPDATRREALTNYIQAGGDEALLAQRAQTAAPKLRPGYKAALNLTDSEKTLATNTRNYLDAQLEEAQKHGMLEDAFVADYIPQLWGKDTAAAQRLRAEAGASELLAKPFFTKHRIFQSYFEGEDAGFVPKSKDVGALLTAYHQSFAKAIAGRGFVKQLLEGKASDGRPLVATSGIGRTIPESELGDGGTFIRANAKPADVWDYRTHDDPSLRRWKWVAEDSAGKPVYTQGDLLVHPEAYKHLKNVLGESAIAKNPVGKVALKLSSEFKNTMLSLSMFHQTQLGLHALEHMVNPVKVPKLDLDEPLQRSLVDHGLQVASFNSAEAFGEGVQGGGLINKLPVLGERFQAYQHYLFHDYIPRLKMQMAKHAFDRNTERYGDKLSQDQILELTAKQANAAFGELNYKMMGRNKTMQDVLRLGLLAPDFLEARGRFVGQALKPYGAEQSSALLRGALAMYVAARVVNQMLNGNPDWDPAHAFTIKVGNRSYGLRTVQGDLLHLLTDPRSFAYNRLNPVTTRPAIEAILGRDERGRKRTAYQQLRDITLGAVPIPFQGLTKDSDADWKATAMAATGVAGYKYRTKAERTAQDLLNKNGVFGESQKSDVERSSIAQHRQHIDKGTFTPAEVWADVKAGKLTKQDAEGLIKEANTPQLVRNVKRLSLEQALKVWDAANDTERKSLRPVLIGKGKRLDDRLPAERDAMQGKLQAALKQGADARLPGFLRR